MISLNYYNAYNYAYFIMACRSYFFTCEQKKILYRNDESNKIIIIVATKTNH